MNGNLVRLTCLILAENTPTIIGQTTQPKGTIMNPVSIAKTAASIVSSIGTGAVVSNAIKASIPARSKTIQKISIGIGGFILSNMVGDMAAKYVTDNIDSAAKQFKLGKENVIVIHQETTEES